jgi:hypothetical protein
LRKVVHRLFGSPKVRYFCKTIVKMTDSTLWLLLCQFRDRNKRRRKSLMKGDLEGLKRDSFVSCPEKRPVTIRGGRIVTPL